MTQIDTEKRKLSARQIKAINSLLSAKDRSEAADQAGVSRKTLYRYLENEDFKRELSRRKNELLETGSCSLTAAVEKAISTLEELLDCKQPNIRRLTAVNILDYAVKLAELRDLEQRISRLEESINARE